MTGALPSIPMPTWLDALRARVAALPMGALDAWLAVVLAVAQVLILRGYWAAATVGRPGALRWE